jgi:putative DNA primase/helicase
VLADGHKHDAFDVYRLLSCGGNWKEALEWNPEITRHNQRVWREQKSKKRSRASTIPRVENPAAFAVDDKGVWYCWPVEPGEAPKRQWICSPLHVRAFTRDEHNEGWGRLLEFTDAENRLHVWAMPMRLLSGDGREYRALLLDMGLTIAPGRPARDCLMIYIQTAKPAAWARCVERTGWHNGAFVLPDEVIGGANDERVLLQLAGNAIRVYRAAGALEDWRREVSALCVGNSRLVFAVSCAFAAPLLHLVGEENGGFHLRGPSSTGKTTVLFVACSVFGGRDYLQRWRATINGLEGVAIQHNDALLCLDELKQVDPREAGEVAYLLANGSGKQRANQHGGAREKYTWRLLFFSSGETSLADHMRTAGKKAHAGQETRLADPRAQADKCSG